MAPTIPPAFEDLPAEMHYQILRQMASPEDVYSTIQASPRALGSFLCFREDILIQALQAHLPPELFTGYLGLLRIPKYEDFNHVPNRSELSVAVRRELSAEVRDDWQDGEDWEWEACKYQAWANVVHHFFKDYFTHTGVTRPQNVPIYDKPKTSEKVEVNYLLSTYGMMKRFIRQYQLFVRKTLANTCPGFDFEPQLREAHVSQELEWAPLSERETFRVHRGFLRYELCCRLNTIPDRGGATLQFRSFGRNFFRKLSEHISHWEDEEIRCIHWFVSKQYQGVARDIVEDFCCDVWRHSRNARHVPDSGLILAPNLTSRADYKKCGGFYSWKSDMSCLGLPLLQQVLQSTVIDQRRFLKNTNLSRLPPYWDFPFMETRSYRGARWHHRANPIYNSVAHTLSTLTYRSWHDGGCPGWLCICSDSPQTGLRETGWVFWEDPSRVEYFALPGHNVKGHHISHSVTTIKYRDYLAFEGLGFEGMGARYPTEMMYVTKEAHQELMDKYTAKPVEPDAELFLLGRLRAISDWSSKEVSPAFQEICSVAHATE